MINLECKNDHFYHGELLCPNCGVLQIPKKFAEYELQGLIGEGTNSKVYKVSKEEDCYALKITAKSVEAAKKEIRMMSRLKGCKNIVQIIDSYSEEGSNAFILQEKLIPFLDCASTLTRKSALKLGIGICDALLQCRDHNIIHLDVQPGNIFYTADGEIKLGDLGMACEMNELESEQTIRGTYWFMAPEIYNQCKYNKTADTYSLGILLYSLFNYGYPPFSSDDGGIRDKEQALKMRFNGMELPNPANMDDKTASVLLKACKFVPSDRYSTIEDFRKELLSLYETSDHEPLELRTMNIAMSSIQQEKPYEIDAMDFALSVAVSVGSVPLSFEPNEVLFKKVSQRVDQRVDTKHIAARTFGAFLLPGILAEQQLESPKLEISKVQFSAVAPKKFNKSEYTLIDIYVYEEEYRSVVNKAVEKLGANGEETSTGIFEVARKSKVRIVLESPDIQIEDNIEEVTWNGKFSVFSFHVFLPNSFSGKQILFTGKVYVDMVLITKIKFIAKVKAFRRQKIKIDKSKTLSAFISYASQDRNKVVARIQGMKKMLPDADIFFDVESLRSGQDWESALWEEIEKRDILYLFWSRNAEKSEWVNKEWKYALQNKGIDAIEPVPLEPPDICPPPEELARKHFNDWTLRYSSNKARDPEDDIDIW